MRIPHSKVWRAFPEFDRFSDESCRAFVRQVSRSGPRAGRIWAASVLLGCLGLVVMYQVLYRIRDSFFNDPHVFDISTPGLVLLSVLLISAGVLSGLVVRDVMLRLELRRLVGSSAQCPRCGYLRIGLHIDERNGVRCPECAFATELDPATIRTSVGADGRRVIVDAKFEAPRLRVPRRVVLWGLRGVFVALVCAGLLVACVVVADRMNARLAAELMPSDAERDANRDAMLGIRRADSSVVSPRQAIAVQTIWSKGDEAWNLTAAMVAALPPEIQSYGFDSGMAALIRRAWRAPGDPVISYDSDLAPIYLSEEQEEDLGRRMLIVLRSAGYIDRLDALEEFLAPTAAGAVSVAALMSSGRTYHSMSAISMINAARMCEAIRLGDDAELVRALRSFLGLWAFNQRLGFYPGADGRFHQSMCLPLAAVRPGMSRAALEEFDRAAEQALLYQVPPRLLIEMELLRHREDVSRELVAFNRWQAIKDRRWRGSVRSSWGGLEAAFGAIDFIGVGGLKRDLDTVAEVFLQGEALRPMSSWEREMVRTSKISDLDGRRRVAFALQSGCKLTLTMRAVRVLVAIERYRQDHGRLPEKLGDLPGEPIMDPLNGLAFGYRRLDPATDEQGRDFVLYSLGIDGVDAGGSSGSEQSLLRSLAYPWPLSGMLDIPLNCGPKMRSPMLEP